jgi:hypothetical protein
MEILLPVIALGFIFLYFKMARKQDSRWQRFRQRHRERIQRPPSEEPIDPNFQFGAAEEEPRRDRE